MYKYIKANSGGYSIEEGSIPYDRIDDYIEDLANFAYYFGSGRTGYDLLYTCTDRYLELKDKIDAIRDEIDMLESEDIPDSKYTERSREIRAARKRLSEAIQESIDAEKEFYEIEFAKIERFFNANPDRYKDWEDHVFPSMY